MIHDHLPDELSMLLNYLGGLTVVVVQQFVDSRRETGQVWNPDSVGAGDLVSTQIEARQFAFNL